VQTKRIYYIKLSCASASTQQQQQSMATSKEQRSAMMGWDEGEILDKSDQKNPAKPS